MIDEQVEQLRVQIAGDLQAMTKTTGWLRFKQEIETRIADSHEKLDLMMDKTPERLTTRMAFRMSANRRVLKSLLDWIDDQIEMGGKAIESLEQEKVK